MSVLTEEQVAVYMDAASSDIKFLLDTEDVDRLTQARLYEAGVLSVKQFAVLCKDVEEMREAAVKELGLEMKTLKDKAKLSMLLVAFAKALRTPDYQGMREAYEKKVWEIEDRKVPSRACVATKLESVEKNDLKVEALTEVTNTREDEGNESFEPNWDPQGGLVAVRKTAKVGLPQTAEDFRYRVTLMGHCWSFVAIEHTNRKYLATLHPHLWSDYLDYLLEESVQERDERRRSCHRVEDILGRSDCEGEVLYDASLLGGDRYSEEKARFPTRIPSEGAEDRKL